MAAPWRHRARPAAAALVLPILKGAPTTLAELRALRMQLRSMLGDGGRPAPSTTTSTACCWRSRNS